MTTVTLEVEDMRIAFGGLRAVDGASFAVGPGEVFGIIGPNGAGKTTLLNGVSGLIPLAGGRVLLNGKAVSGLRPHQIAALGITRTFQNAQYFKDMRAAEYVTLGLMRQHLSLLGPALGTRRVRAQEAEYRQRSVAALESLGLPDLADERLRELAYGVQRLVDVARALVSQPTVVLLDEPTSGTVRAERERLEEIITGLGTQGVTTVVVDHDVNFIRRCCHRVFVMSYGQPLGVGTPEEVFARPDVREVYMGLGG
jgi:branched-chain amino acid transport system ATP-binding protein